MTKQGRPVRSDRDAQEDAAITDRRSETSLRSAGLVVICFVAGAALMIVELTGYRVLAPVFGNSLQGMGRPRRDNVVAPLLRHSHPRRADTRVMWSSRGRP